MKDREIIKIDQSGRKDDKRDRKQTKKRNKRLYQKINTGHKCVFAATLSMHITSHHYKFSVCFVEQTNNKYTVKQRER